MFGYGYLSDEQLNRVLDHKYKASGISALEPLLQPFWNKLAPHVPKSISPNAITVYGMAAALLTISPILYYSSDFKSEIPSFCLILFAIGIFVYQTFDALDGKHARRINLCSPLGEFLDHGCDSITTYVLTLGYCGALGLGDYPIVVLIEFFIMNCVFYTAQWQAYVTGAICFDSFSVTEALISSMAFTLISATFGIEFWRIRDPIFGLPMSLIQFLVVLIGAIVLLSRFTGTISVGGSGKFGTTVANTSVLFPICPLLLVMGSAIMVFVYSPSDVLRIAPLPFYLCFGAAMARISQNVLVGGMTRSAISLFDPVMLGPLSLLMNLYWDCPINEQFLIWISCLWSTVCMVYLYCCHVVQIADCLGIGVFSTKRLSKPSGTMGTSSSSSIRSRPAQPPAAPSQRTTRARQNTQPR